MFLKCTVFPFFIQLCLNFNGYEIDRILTINSEPNRKYLLKNCEEIIEELFHINEINHLIEKEMFNNL
jgi:hypothetical protein